MRPHFAVVLLAVSLVAAMDKAERLREPSSPPNRKSGDDSAQGHVRGALTTDEERGANTLFLNAAASQVPHLRERGQLGAWFQPQEAVKETTGDHELIRLWDNYAKYNAQDNVDSFANVASTFGALGSPSMIAKWKSGSKRAQIAAVIMEERLKNMQQAQEVQRDVARGAKLVTYKPPFIEESNNPRKRKSESDDNPRKHRRGSDE
uniref:RxLR effector protein n=1 Tax=Peronospora matthiolae TaxID=2874970 RepID=A0AAV1VLZ1_9STRA